jgi:hypothetical protein
MPQTQDRAHLARDNLATARVKTSILISPEVWSRVKQAAPMWALSIGIDPDNKVSMWVEHVLDKAAREQLDQQEDKPKPKAKG